MNRTILITGASRGLGLALAKQFVASGDQVCGISRTKTAWENACKTIQSKNLKLFQADLKSEKTVKTLIAKITKQAGAIDILINNAGYCGPLKRVEEISCAEFQKHLTQNLFTTFLMCKYAIPAMLRQRQSLLINISSMAGTRAVPRLMPYSVSKFGILALSQAIAKENAGTGLHCVTVCPGGMNTEMRRELFGVEDAARQQAPGFVANVICQIADKKINVLSGGHIIIRHSKITAICPPPEA